MFVGTILLLMIQFFPATSISLERNCLHEKSEKGLAPQSRCGQSCPLMGLQASSGQGGIMLCCSVLLWGCWMLGVVAL